MAACKIVTTLTKVANGFTNQGLLINFVKDEGRERKRILLCVVKWNPGRKLRTKNTKKVQWAKKKVADVNVNILPGCNCNWLKETRGKKETRKRLRDGEEVREDCRGGYEGRSVFDESRARGRRRKCRRRRRRLFTRVIGCGSTGSPYLYMARTNPRFDLSLAVSGCPKRLRYTDSAKHGSPTFQK